MATTIHPARYGFIKSNNFTSGNILPAEVNSMLLSLENHFATDKVQGVAVMGSMPPGCTRDMYSNILLRVCDSETKVLSTHLPIVCSSLNTP